MRSLHADTRLQYKRALPSVLTYKVQPASADTLNMLHSHVGWGCRIHRLNLCKEVISPNEDLENYTKQADCEVPIILGLQGMRSTYLLPSFPDLNWSGVEAPDRVLSVDQTVLMLN